MLATFALLGVGACHRNAPETVPEGAEHPAARGTNAILENEDLEHRQATRFEELLEARVSGVRVTRLADGNYHIQVRGVNTFHGSSEPLFVLDGVPLLDRRTLTGLNPADIERIEVLKDATAAAYGARGANGVILITTKRP